MTVSFADFALADTLKQALTDLEFTSPTPVQAEAIPLALEGRDLLVSSRTGSGKTAAFLLPSLNPLATTEQGPFSARLKAMPAPEVLVLCPTRELAQQVSQDAIKLVRHVKGVRIASVVGGMPFGKQIAQLKGAQVVVATPGRLLDLVNRRQITLDKVRTLILDEADRMLDLGFSEDLEAISELSANRAQTLMFSATFADRVLTLAEAMTKNPERVALQTEQTTNADITQTLHWTDGFEHKKKLLNHWLSDESLDQAVVFASTQEDTDLLAEELAEAGHQVVALHGAMPQAVRNRRIKTLREGRARVLVATDVAARGLDVPSISHVINFGLPMKNEDYVHRIGRTGRAGRSGQAITLATHRERGKIRALETYLQSRLPVSEIVGLEPSPPPAGPRKNGRSYDNRGGRMRSGGRVEGERNFRTDSREGYGARPDGRSESRGDAGRPAWTDRDDAGNRAARGQGDHAGNRSERPRRDFDAPRGHRPEGNGFERRERRFDDRPRGEGRGFGQGGFGDTERRPRDDDFGNRMEQPRPAWQTRGEARPARTDGDRPQWRERRGFGDRPQGRADGRPEGRFDSREPRHFDRAPRPAGEGRSDLRPSRTEGHRPDGNRADRFEGSSDRPRRRFGRDED